MHKLRYMRLCIYGFEQLKCKINVYASPWFVHNIERSVFILRFMVTTIPEEEHHAQVKRRESAVDPKDLPRRPSAAVVIVGETDE